MKGGEKNEPSSKDQKKKNSCKAKFNISHFGQRAMRNGGTINEEFYTGLFKRIGKDNAGVF